METPQLQNDLSINGSTDIRDQNRYQFLFESSRDILLVIRLINGQVIEANRAAEAAYGYSHAEMLDLNVFDLRASQAFSTIARQMLEADAHGLLFETLHRRKDGTVFPVEVSSSGTVLDGERVILSIVRDISARKQT